MADNEADESLAMDKVLGDDDLLREILLRLGFPTTLVRAAVVCKRWLRHASQPAFLRSFRERHPPGLLGVYVTVREPPQGWMMPIRPEFVPVPQPAELDVILSRDSRAFELDSNEEYSEISVQCWNDGSMLLYLGFLGGIMTVGSVRCPLLPKKARIYLPASPLRYAYTSVNIIPSNTGDGLSVFLLALRPNYRMSQQTIADFSELKDGTVWINRVSTAIDIPRLEPESEPLLVGNKVYMVASKANHELTLSLLDIETSTFSAINLPDEMEHMYDGDYLLSKAYDSGVFLTHVKGTELHVWLLDAGAGEGNNWLLVNTVCLTELAAFQTIPTRQCEDDTDEQHDHHVVNVKVHAVGLNAEFVLLEMGDGLYSFHVASKVEEKVLDLKPMHTLTRVSPVFVTWPPIFPAIELQPASDPKE
ncbi:hypothetical protein ABZP36_024289 [Zizania latifolia]